MVSQCFHVMRFVFVVDSCLVPTLVNYAADLAKVMKKILLFSKIAALAKEIEKEYVLEMDAAKIDYRSRAVSLGVTSEKIAPYLLPTSSIGHSQDEEEGNEEDDSFSLGNTTVRHTPLVIDPDKKDKLTKTYSFKNGIPATK